MKSIKSKIYRCSKENEMYLYIHADKTIDDLPTELLELVKGLTHVFDLELTPERKLAREDVVTVMNNLEQEGYHLQMPENLLKPQLHYGD